MRADHTCGLLVYSRYTTIGSDRSHAASLDSFTTNHHPLTFPTAKLAMCIRKNEWQAFRGSPQSQRRSLVKRMLTLSLGARGPVKLIQLEDLPAEILEHIARLACTDGGRTGCSLSLVSKNIHAVSRAGRFDSVSLLTGTRWQITSFMKCFDAASAVAEREGTSLPKIHHLCIATTTGNDSDPILDFQPLFGDPRTDFEQCLIDHRIALCRLLSRAAFVAHINELNTSYQAALQNLIQSVSTNLETLCLLQRRESDLDTEARAVKCRIICSGFPALRELSFHNTSAIFLRPEGTEPTDDPFFPALTRLCISSPRDRIVDLQHWAQNAPNLTYLRVVHRWAGPEIDSPRYLNLMEAIFGEAERSELWRKLDTALLLFDAEPMIQFFAPGRAMAHIDGVNQLIPLLREHAPHSFSHPWYKRQDVRPEYVRGKASEMENVEVFWLDWRSRTAREGGAYDPDYWEKLLENILNPPAPSLGSRFRQISRQVLRFREDPFEAYMNV